MPSSTAVRELRQIDKLNLAANKEQADAKMQASFLVQIELRKELAKVKWEILQTEIQLEHLKAEAAREQSQQTAESIPNVQAAGAEPAEGAAPEIQIPDFAIEEVLLGDPEYVAYETKRSEAEQWLKVYEKRFHPHDRRILEKRGEVEKHKRDQEAYRERRFPEIREQMLAELKERVEYAQRDAESGLEVPGAQLLATPADPLEAARKSLDRLKLVERDYESQLETNRNDTNDLATQWVDREIKAKEVQKLEEDVSKIQGYVDKRELERDHAPDAIEVKRPATEPSQPDQGKRIKMAGAAGFGVLALVVGGVVLLEYSARRLNSVNEVQTDLNLQVMSTIPLMPRWVNSDSGNSRSSARNIGTAC